MTQDPLMLVWQQYGWLGFLGYVMVREVWPFVREKVWPEKIAQAKIEKQRMINLEDRQMNAVDRQVAAGEAMTLAVQNMAIAITTNNERLSTLISGHSIHAQDTVDAIMLMRERTNPHAVKAQDKTE